jgi:hypothetical protein
LPFFGGENFLAAATSFGLGVVADVAFFAPPQPAVSPRAITPTSNERLRETSKRMKTSKKKPFRAALQQARRESP